ncbi:MAG: ThiF family adenylyltransferase [Nanoarchaeota archaeon]
MRYLRQIIFEKLGESKQRLLEQSTAVVVGVGAIGSISAELLARAGVNLVLIDRDIVELNNLQRQKLFTEHDINKSKAIVAKERLSSINKDINIEAYVDDLDYENISSLAKGNILLDCTDNFETRFLINEYAAKKRIPWIYSAVIGSSGMVMNIVPGKTACFRCVFNEPTALLGTCDTEGILNTIPNVISAMQATEAIKLLTKQPYSKELIHYDIWTNKLVKNKVNRQKDCPVCNKKFEYLTGEKRSELVKYCGTNTYQIKCRNNLNELEKRFTRLGRVVKSAYHVSFENVIAFNDRVLVKANSKEEARSIFDRYLK